MTMTGLHFVPFSLNLDIPFGSLKKSLKAKADTTNMLSIGANKKAVCGNRRQVIVDYGCLLSTYFIINKNLYKVN